MLKRKKVTAIAGIILLIASLIVLTLPDSPPKQVIPERILQTSASFATVTEPQDVVLTLNAAAPYTTYVNGTSYFTGTVKTLNNEPAVSHPVLIQLKTKLGWITKGSGITDATGAYKIKIPTFWYGIHDWRANAPGNASYNATATGFTKPQQVKPSYTPAGYASSYTLLSARWNPCTSVGWYFNTQKSPSGGLTIAKNAFDEITRASGITFVYKGTTSSIPFSTQANRGLKNGYIVVSWATASQVSKLSGSVAGVGGGTYSTTQPTPAEYRYINGGVALDSNSLSGYSESKKLAYRNNIMRHELGHVMGLSHSTGSGQIMRATGSTQQHYGAGDITALSRKGLVSGCTTAFYGETRTW